MNNQDQKERRLNTDSVTVNQPTKPANSDKNTDSNAQNDNKNSSPQNQLEGYSLKFNTPSKNLGDAGAPFIEVIAPNALDGVDFSNVFLLNDHDYSEPLASVKAGTLKLDVDNVGLHFVATLPDTTLAKDTIENVKSGNTTDTSFAFIVAPDGDTFSTDENGTTVRTIKKIASLLEISVCTVGAYSFDDAVKVNTRSYDKWLESQNKKDDNKGEKRSMTEKTIIEPTEKQEHIETRAFEDFLRSNGEQRNLEGLTTDRKSVV